MNIFSKHNTAIILAALRNLQNDIDNGVDLTRYQDIIDPAQLDSGEIDALCEAINTTEERLTIALHLDQGLIRGILVNSAPPFPVHVFSFDYDVEGVDEDEITLITQNDGREVEAFVCHHELIDTPAIRLEDVFSTINLDVPLDAVTTSSAPASKP